MLLRAGLGEKFQVQADGLKSVQYLHPDGSPKGSAGAGLKAANKHSCFCLKTSCCFKEREALPIFYEKPQYWSTVMDRKMRGSCSWRFNKKDNQQQNKKHQEDMGNQ